MTAKISPTVEVPRPLRTVSNEVLLSSLRELVAVERSTTAEILEFIREVDQRRLYLKKGFSSLFVFLTEDLGYSNAAAQRRIQSARLLERLPEIKAGISSGAVTLSQASLLASVFNQEAAKNKNIPLDRQRQLLDRVKKKSFQDTQRIVAEEFELPVRKFDKATPQRDASLRLELTLSPEDVELWKQVREVLSHTHPNPSWAELFSIAGKELLKRRDPRRLVKPCAAGVRRKVRKGGLPEKGLEKKGGFKKKGYLEKKKEDVENHTKQEVEDHKEVADQKPQRTPAPTSAAEVRARHRKHIANPTRRAVHQRDHCCQWIDEVSGRRCNSTFQAEVDHIVPLWAGGENTLDNLRILCRAHNQHKYRQEAGLRSV